jgi:DNA-binding NarL/FixJ family response regulator
MLSFTRTAVVFVGIHRARRDFDADDMAIFDLVRQPLACALAFRAAWQDSMRRCRAAIDDPIGIALTSREEQVIGLVALGWTNGRIGRHLRISRPVPSGDASTA